MAIDHSHATYIAPSLLGSDINWARFEMPEWLFRPSTWNIRPQGIQLSFKEEQRPKPKSGRWIVAICQTTLAPLCWKPSESQGPTLPFVVHTHSNRAYPRSSSHIIVSLTTRKWPTFVILGRQDTYVVVWSTCNWIRGVNSYQRSPIEISRRSPCLHFRIEPAEIR
jgi:hypothetical protein